MARKQCAKCPWKVTTNPNEIPNGYSVQLHQGLEVTIAGRKINPSGPIHIMACHESPVGEEIPCAGWLMNQLGPGNNIPLRLAVVTKCISADVELVGEQHERLEDTLPTGE